MMRLGLGGTALLASALAASGAAGDQQRVKAKRAAPAEVQELLQAGIRYVVPHFGASHAKVQNGGYVQARAADSDRLLWDRMVYRVVFDDSLERDTQDVFITKIALQRGQLIVDNDVGERFAMDLETGTVSAVVKRSPRTALPPSEPRK